MTGSALQLTRALWTYAEGLLLNVLNSIQNAWISLIHKIVENILIPVVPIYKKTLRYLNTLLAVRMDDAHEQFQSWMYLRD